MNTENNATLNLNKNQSNKKANLAKLKQLGFFPQKEKGFYQVRIVLPGGSVDAAKLVSVAELAQKYGRGRLITTTRMNIEIPWIKEEDIPKVHGEILAMGLELGGATNGLRPITPCKGTHCPYSHLNTSLLADHLNLILKSKGSTPHKFKIAIAGCPNSCVKPQINDVGLVGQVKSYIEEDNCINCGLCVRGCPVKAINTNEKYPSIDEDKCIKCGNCIKVCPTRACRVKQSGIGVYVGGKIGKKYNFGRLLYELVPMEQVPGIVEGIMDFYREEGRKGERLIETLERIGWEALEKKVSKKIISR